MATDKYPNRNVNMPLSQAAVDRARARLDPGRSVAGTESLSPSGGGKGSRREVRPGEWIDDRKINIGGPASPSNDSPPELPAEVKRDKSVSYNDNYVYQVNLLKPCVVDGRMLAPAKSYVMIGSVLNTITDNIVNAFMIDDIPQDPDAPPSE